MVECLKANDSGRQLLEELEEKMGYKFSGGATKTKLQELGLRNLTYKDLLSFFYSRRLKLEVRSRTQLVVWRMTLSRRGAERVHGVGAVAERTDDPTENRDQCGDENDPCATTRCAGVDGHHRTVTG